MIVLLEICGERYNKMWARAKEKSIDMVSQGNKQTHLKRYLNKRMRIWEETLSRQETIAGL